MEQKSGMLKYEGSACPSKIVPNLFSFHFNDIITIRPMRTTRAVLLPTMHHFHHYATLLLFLRIFLTFFVPFHRYRQVGKTSTCYEFVPLKTPNNFSPSGSCSITLPRALTSMENRESSGCTDSKN